MANVADVTVARCISYLDVLRLLGIRRRIDSAVGVFYRTWLCVVLLLRMCISVSAMHKHNVLSEAWLVDTFMNTERN